METLGEMWESEVTSDSDLECDMPATTPLPPTDVREEDFDINSPLGEYVVDFLMENVDVAGLPRHLEFEVDLSLFDLLFGRTIRHPLNADREIGFNPCRDIEELEPFPSDGLVPSQEYLLENVEDLIILLHWNTSRVEKTEGDGAPFCLVFIYAITRPTAYSPTEVDVIAIPFPNLSSGDGFGPWTKMNLH
ncbi:hypothetical protein Tco_0928600 [Tanacetum coccineum]